MILWVNNNLGILFLEGEVAAAAAAVAPASHGGSVGIGVRPFEQARKKQDDKDLMEILTMLGGFLN